MSKRTLRFVLLSVFPLLLCTTSIVRAQWQPDVRLTFDPLLSATSYNNAWCVVASGDSVHVVWYDSRHGPGTWEIYYKRSTNGGTAWGADTRLTYDDSTSSFPTVAVSGPNVHVAWQEMRDQNPEIYFKRSTDAGSTWGADTRLTRDTSYSYYPSLAVFGSDVHAVWEDGRDGNSEIYTKRSTDAGSTWGPDVRLTNDPASSSIPSVAVTGSNVHVVWSDYRDGDLEIYTKRSTDGGASWDPDVRLTNASNASMFSSVAVSGSNVHVVWTDQRDIDPEVYYIRSTDNGTTWDPDTRLTYRQGSSLYASIAASGPMVHLIWKDVGQGIYYKRSTDSGTTWAPDTVVTYSSGIVLYPSVAVSGPKVHAVWWDSRDGPSGNVEIYYKRNLTGNSGVQEGIVPAHASRLMPHAIPNPFVNFTTLPGHEAERFVLYDISGRRVGVWKGDRVGEGLPAGVYFIRPEGRDVKPLRIVKVR